MKNITDISIAKLRRLQWSIKKITPLKARTHGFQNSTAKHRWLLITLDDEICQSQVFPFYFYLNELRQSDSVDLLEVRLADFEKSRVNPALKPTAVFYQFWQDKSPEQARELARRIRTEFPDATIVFFDPFAPTDLRYASSINPFINKYVKKHALKNREQYLEPTLGDTNLVDWYSRYFRLTQSLTKFDIPDGFFSKLMIGPSFLTAPYLLPIFWSGNRTIASTRSIDVHCRLGGLDHADWYGEMRRLAATRIHELDFLTLTGHGPVKRRQYLRELKQSKMCVSPFGYGEVCWRDYEAIAFGAVLIKPSMAHAEVNPSLFIPNETYVPCSWDFSDISDVIVGLWKDEDRIRQITTNAFELIQTYVRSNRVPHFLFSAVV